MTVAKKSTIAAVGIALSLAAGLVLFDGSWRAVASEDVKVFSSAYGAAYIDSLNIKTEPVISTLKQGDEVTVMGDTLGKDYWACYVRTPNGHYGWVLCTSLRRVS